MVKIVADIFQIDQNTLTNTEPVRSPPRYGAGRVNPFRMGSPSSQQTTTTPTPYGGSQQQQQQPQNGASPASNPNQQVNPINIRNGK
jgi:hypothetical protein